MKISGHYWFKEYVVIIVSVTFFGVIMVQQVCTSSMVPMCNTCIYNVLHDVIKNFPLHVVI